MSDKEGCSICIVRKKMLEKELFLSALIKQDANIKETLLEVLEKQGCVYGLRQQGILKAICIFVRKKENDKSVLCYSYSLYTKEVESQRERFEQAIAVELKERVSMGSVSKVYWNDMEIIPSHNGQFSGITFSFCIVLGLVLGIGMHNILIGLLLGVISGICTSAILKKRDGN